MGSIPVAGAKKVLLRICVVIPFLVTGNGIEGEAAQSKLSVNVCDRGRPSPQARPIPVAGAKNAIATFFVAMAFFSSSR